MNLHAIAGPVVAAVNPNLLITLRPSTAGYTTLPDGSRVETYSPDVTNVPAQVQSLTYNDLQKLDGLNLTGERQAVYLSGDWRGVVRPDQKGGDLIIFPDGEVWLVVQVLEDWAGQDGWVKLAITRQVS